LDKNKIQEAIYEELSSSSTSRVDKGIGTLKDYIQAIYEGYPFSVIDFDISGTNVLMAQNSIS